ncbi:MAG: ECF-type sigma factor [Planctomycetota bacterium]
MDSKSPEVQELIDRIRGGDDCARNELIARAHGELRMMAGHFMARQPVHHTLQVTALVSEACLRLMRSGDWQDQAHFLRVAAAAMRCVLVDHARTKQAVRRAPDGERLEMDVLLEWYEHRSGNLTALGAALERLRDRNLEAAELIDLRFFAGLPVSDCARILGKSTRHVQRLWQTTRARLRLEMDS